MSTQIRQVESTSPEDTQALAGALAALLKPGDAILLDGPVGAGKSHFARSAILSLLAEPEDVPSPTYTLVQTYLTPKGEVWHADLYRLSDPAEIHELGLWTAFEDAVCFVEWPDRLGTDAPLGALSISFEPMKNDQTRRVRFSWNQDRWDACMKEVLGDRTVVA